MNIEEVMLRYPHTDGTIKTFHLNYKPRVLVEMSGLGMPDVDTITQSGPFQHGSSLISYRLQPRIIQFEYREFFDTRLKTQYGRTRLVDALRYNRGEITLRFRMTNNELRDITVFLEKGPDFAETSSIRRQFIQDTIRFVALDPTFYNPEEKSVSFQDIAESLVFPFYFNIPLPMSGTIILPYYQRYGMVFNEFSQDATAVVNGDWVTYPTLVIHGPVHDYSLHNVTTGEWLRLNNLSSSDVLRITTSYANKSITDSNGDLAFSFLKENSDLGTFHLDPGDNYLIMEGVGTSSATYTSITWYDRFLSIGATE